MIPAADTVLEVDGLSKRFRVGRGGVVFGRRAAESFVAVDDVSLRVARGETLGIVGESGSGKSTLARMLLRLVEPSAGRVVLGGRELTGMPAEELRRQRRGIQMVFQDPFASLNPRLSIGYHLAEPLLTHDLAARSQARDRVVALLARVGLDARHARSHPHALSGGQRQRIAIARALAVEPQVLVADEAVSSLDVSVQAQILNLLRDIGEDTQLSMIFISHDLGVVRYIADRVAVMYRGRIVETGPVDQVFDRPSHPYTRRLLDAVPAPVVGEKGPRERPPSDDASAPPAGGCAYLPRCPIVAEACAVEVPGLRLVGPQRASACLRSALVPEGRQRERNAGTQASQRLRSLQERFLAMGQAGAA